LDVASRHEHCDWDLTDRVRKEGYSVLLPEFQTLREFATLLALRARLAIHEKQIDNAIQTCRTGLALSRHAAEGPSLISGLVGIFVANTMLAEVERLVDHGGTPNLYWALTDLPRPFIDMRVCFQSERLSLEAFIRPEIRAALKNPDAAPMSPGQLQEMNRALLQFAPESNGEFHPAALAILSAKVYPRARDFLLKRGFTTSQVNALPVVQVAFMYAVTEYDRHFDNMVKWLQLPYWEARPGLLKAERELKLSKARLLETGGIPLAEWFIPATQKVVFARARLDRRIAALRCVEALRLYAAAHEGRLPAELADINEVPVPIDPITGKSFQYRLDGSAAVLASPPPDRERPSESNSLRYEITLRQ
jgi:hypothetical protein